MGNVIHNIKSLFPDNNLYGWGYDGFQMSFGFVEELQEYFVYDKTLRSFDGIKIMAELTANLQHNQNSNTLPTDILCDILVTQNPKCIKSLRIKNILWEVNNNKLCLKEGTISTKTTLIPINV